MKNYLVLHIDTDFLVGTVCADENDLSYPIKNGEDELLWLYFYNDPYSNIVSFGKKNQKNCSEGKINYYGNFIELIENENNTFQIGEYEYPVIELLRYSKIIDKLKNDFSTHTHESQDNIPTLLTFSLSVGELAKQKLVDYLKKQGFEIVSYTIPLAELSCCYALKQGNVNYENGNIVAFLEASNSDLHLLKLIYTSDYFLSYGIPDTKRGLGIDPRKRALLKFVVNQIGTMGILAEHEKETEYKIMEPKTDEWLKRLDMQTNNNPVEIIESLSKMPNAKRRVLIYKDRISEFTGSDMRLIMDCYNDYVNRNILQDVSAIILLGNCFQNNIIQSKFQNLIENDRLFIYSNREIHNILSVYPKIDFQRYINEEQRIKAKAAAEEQKQVKQRALENRQRKEQEETDKRQAEAAEAEQNRKEAQKLYERAVELEKEGKLEDARVNAENAIALDKTNIEYKQFFDDLKKEIKELGDKTDKYKSWLKDAENYERSDDLTNSLTAYKYAQQIFDSTDLRKKIIETESKIEKRKKEREINNLIDIAIQLSEKGMFEDAVANINKALELDPAHQTAKETLKKIYALQSDKETDEKYKKIVDKADTFFKKQDFDKAAEQYDEALSIKAGDKYCADQINRITDITLQKQNREKARKIIAEANKFFEKELWEDAKTKYEEALKLCPNDNDIQEKIKDCRDKLKAIKDKYNDLISDANIEDSKKKPDLNKVLSFLEDAEKIAPKNTELKKRIKKIKNLMKFEDFGEAPFPQKTKENKSDFLGTKKENIKLSTTGGDFLSNKKSKTDKKDDEENLIKNPPKDIKSDFLLTNSDKKYCKHCGKQILGRPPYCRHCGKEL